MNDSVFPNNTNSNNGLENMAIQLFGNRIYVDQSLYEYLAEFLLVFLSPKDKALKNGAMLFHESNSNEFAYYVKPRMGLKRFIFFPYAKKDNNVLIDEKAYKDILDVLSCKLREKNSDKDRVNISVTAIQELLYSYATVTKNRSWTAQSLLPIAPELVFCEVMPNTPNRLKCSSNDENIDMLFEFSKHNFMARGGEVYYLHIVQSLKECTTSQKNKLEKLLKNIFFSNYFSQIANWVDNTWIKANNFSSDKLWVRKPLGFIPASGYLDCGKKTIYELTTFLSNEMHPITRIELLSKGVVFQVMRMMCERTAEYLKTPVFPWVIDVYPKKSKDSVKKISADSYKRIDEQFTTAINKKTIEHTKQLSTDEKKISPLKYLADARSHTLNMFKRLGKEMHLIVPIKGAYERFSLPEDLLKFLVLSLIKPQEKITFDMFLDKLYEHYNIVIGPKQFKKCSCILKMNHELADDFIENEIKFQDLLKNAGFLRDLSDAMSVVVNPYMEVVIYE